MNEEYWQAIVSCDNAYDGQFWYGVLTTGIFCRPSCKSRVPKKENIRIFANTAEPESIGLRPCKRCQPHLQHWRPADEELANRVEQLIDKCYQEPLTLQEIASRLFVSPYYLQRSFTRLKLCSPTQYLSQKRVDAAKELLTETTSSVTDIAMQVGFRTSAYFAQVFHKVTGQTPTQYRSQEMREVK
ncbi:bifunctional transcriptional activator/DNA repair enzyme AdaA [uncultured Brevibacillus sp.]|uniref:bifunctional transcriptional activator/DNA repair enzyme AdaA n=1 Tax=uncultured Brevibacillus sp. TaxID=169970 RepID=UPI002591A558|nr:bifunctional transcriptional activator/DNA repair enzyme AdaA [uncultured Brevibacillus sp.]